MPIDFDGLPARRAVAAAIRAAPAAMSGGFRVTLLVDRRPLRTTEHHGTTYALAAPGRAFEVAISHSNNATYMVRLEVDGVDAEPVRAAGGRTQAARVRGCREGAKGPRAVRAVRAADHLTACLLTAACSRLRGRTHAQGYLKKVRPGETTRYTGYLCRRDIHEFLFAETPVDEAAPPSSSAAAAQRLGCVAATVFATRRVRVEVRVRVRVRNMVRVRVRVRVS